MNTTGEISQMIGGMPRAAFYQIKKELGAKAAVEGFNYLKSSRRIVYRRMD
jgi:hypothetical protein